METLGTGNKYYFTTEMHLRQWVVKLLDKYLNELKFFVLAPTDDLMETGKALGTPLQDLNEATILYEDYTNLNLVVQLTYKDGSVYYVGRVNGIGDRLIPSPEAFISRLKLLKVPRGKYAYFNIHYTTRWGDEYDRWAVIYAEGAYWMYKNSKFIRQCTQKSEAQYYIYKEYDTFLVI